MIAASQQTHQQSQRSSKSLVVLIISDRGSLGGAAIAAGRVSVAMAERGHFTAIYSAGKFSPPSDQAHRVLHLREPPNTADSPLRIWLKRRRALPSAEEVMRHFDRCVEELQPDCILVNNLHLAYPGWGMTMAEHVLTRFPTVPIVWLLHDMWALTGSCTSSFSCDRFKSVSGCGPECPQAGKGLVPPAQAVGPEQERRRRLYGQAKNLRFVAPSRWLCDEMDASGVSSSRTLRVDYPMPLNHFVMGERRDFRRGQGVPGSFEAYLLSAGVSFSDPGKGLHLLLNALKILGDERILLSFLGKRPAQPPEASIPVHFLGYRTGDLSLSAAYNTGDIFVHPSLADNQPLVLLEAMACGLPVIGLPVTGVPELVRHGETGWLAREATAEALAEAIRCAMNARQEWPEYSKRCIRFARERFSMELAGKKYEYLFNQMIAGNLDVSQTELDEIR